MEKLADGGSHLTKPRGEHLLDLAWRYELADGGYATDATSWRTS